MLRQVAVVLVALAAALVAGVRAQCLVYAGGLYYDLALANEGEYAHRLYIGRTRWRIGKETRRGSVKRKGGAIAGRAREREREEIGVGRET